MLKELEVLLKMRFLFGTIGNMHTYSTDSEERRIILLILAVISIVLTWITYQRLNYYKIVLPWWSESPSILFFYGLFYTIFDKSIWKLLGRVGLVKTPNLNGKWKGFLATSFNDNTSKIKATLEIFQTWSRMKIVLTTNQSVSRSEVSSIVTQNPEGQYLNYQYFNEPKPNAVQTMNIHHGTANLLFNEKNNSLSGEYYSGRGRQNFGSLFFKKKRQQLFDKTIFVSHKG